MKRRRLRLGLDASEVPRIIAMVMEAYSNGILSEDDTDGLDLTWGNYEAVIEVLDKIVRRDGIGGVMAKGLREAARQLGTEDMAVHIGCVGLRGNHQVAKSAMQLPTTRVRTREKLGHSQRDSA